MANRLYVIPGSHPSMAGRLMLERKGIEYKRRDLVSPLHRGVLRIARFKGVTVPAIKLDDGTRIQGTRNFSRELDKIRPDPPLFPADPEQRRAVEEAEKWGDEELQPVARRLSWWLLSNKPELREGAVKSFMQGAKIGMPIGVAAKTAAPLVKAAARANKATDEAARADLEALPGMLDRVDQLIADGVIGGGQPNAADYQIATSLRLLLCFDDLRPFIENRPAGELAKKVVPEFPGHIGNGFPEELLEPLRATAAAA